MRRMLAISGALASATVFLSVAPAQADVPVCSIGQLVTANGCQSAPAVCPSETAATDYWKAIALRRLDTIHQQQRTIANLRAQLAAAKG